MKKVLFVCLIALGMIFTSCSKQKDSYYVRYEVETIDMNGHYTSSNIELNADTIIVKAIGGKFVETYGPFKYHDFTYLKISCYHGHYDWNTVHAIGKIYVSKNEEPFVLKSEIDTRLKDSFCEISYIIDY